jgi:hypothetical protein
VGFIKCSLPVNFTTPKDNSESIISKVINQRRFPSIDLLIQIVIKAVFLANSATSFTPV